MSYSWCSAANVQRQMIHSGWLPAAQQLSTGTHISNISELHISAHRWSCCLPLPFCYWIASCVNDTPCTLLEPFPFPCWTANLFVSHFRGQTCIWRQYEARMWPLLDLQSAGCVDGWVLSLSLSSCPPRRIPVLVANKYIYTTYCTQATVISYKSKNKYIFWTYRSFLSLHWTVGTITNPT